MGFLRWLLVLGLMLVVGASAWSQVYKWVDPSGVTHYGPVPPVGAKATLVQPAAPAAPAAAVSAPAAPRRPSGVESRPAMGGAGSQSPTDPGAAGRDASPADRLRRCASARQQLDVLTLGGPVFRRDAQGRREYLADELRDGEIARMRAEKALHCTGLDSDDATRLRWQQMHDFVLCDRVRSLLQALDADRSRVPNQDHERTTRLVAEACAPGRFPPDTGTHGEWFRQYVLPGELGR